MTTPTAAGLTPDLFGYVRCARCKTWRPIALTLPLGPDGIEGRACSDSVAWCSSTAGLGKGELTGAET